MYTCFSRKSLMWYCPIRTVVRPNKVISWRCCRFLCSDKQRNGQQYVEEDHVTTLRRKVQTAVVFLHFGEPRTPKDAIDYLYDNGSHYYRNVPYCLLKKGIDAWLKVNGTKYLEQLYQQAFNEQLPDLYSIHQKQTAIVKKALDTVIPEFGPFGCYFGYKHGYDKISDVVDYIHRDAPKHVVVMPHYPHYWCFQSQTCINELSTILLSKSVKVDDDGTVRQLIRSDVFEVTPPIRWSLVDRWPSHPSLVEAWSQVILEQVERFPIDSQQDIALVFCAPYKRFYDSTTYEQQVHSSCIRISEALRNRFPWRFGWFSSWDQWKYRGIRNDLLSAIRFLVRQKRRNIIIVPFTYASQCLDTSVVLPSLLSEENLKMIGAGTVKIAGPLSEHSIFANGLAELVKNHLLDEYRTSAQFSLHCPYCFNSVCRHSKQLFLKH